MAIKVNVGLSRKVGEANYGSRGASVNVEVEVDASLVSEPDQFRERIRQLFDMVRTSLSEELNGANGHATPSTQTQSRAEKRPAPTPDNGTQRFTGPRSNRARPATPAQVKAVYAIARSQRLDLAAFLHERFQVTRPDDLTVQEASQAIDALKGAREQAAT